MTRLLACNEKDFSERTSEYNTMAGTLHQSKEALMERSRKLGRQNNRREALSRTTAEDRCGNLSFPEHHHRGR